MKFVQIVIIQPIVDCILDIIWNVEEVLAATIAAGPAYISVQQWSYGVHLNPRLAALRDCNVDRR